jgi:hypothetical protein
VATQGIAVSVAPRGAHSQSLAPSAFLWFAALLKYYNGINLSFRDDWFQQQAEEHYSSGFEKLA